MALLSPDEKDANDLEFPAEPVGVSDNIREVARTPLRFVWAVSEGWFAQYVAHDIVGSSKYLLHPTVPRGRFLSTILR